MTQRIGQLNDEIGRNDMAWRGNGMRDGDYLAERARSLTGERARLEAEIERLQVADDDSLIAELVPEAERNRQLEENPPPSLRDSLTKRGQMLPGQQVVVNQDEPRPVRREGGAPGTPWESTGALPSGVTYTYDKAGNLIPA
jgi:hypothetical protein